MRFVLLSRLLSPWNTFLTIWAVQIALYSLDIAEFLPSGPEAWSVIWSIFLLSAIPFGLGCVIGLLLIKALESLFPGEQQGGPTLSLTISALRLRATAIALALLILLITAANWQSYGPLPAVTVLTGVTSDYSYLNYGRLMYVVFGSAMFLATLSLFERSKVWAALMLGFAAGIFLAYVSRGFLIQAILQYAIFRTLLKGYRVGTRSLLLLVVIVAGVGIIMGVVGSVRTGTGQFISAMQIKEEWRAWPSGVLWLIGYISFPLANMITLYTDFNAYTGGVLNLTATVPPIFWNVFGLQDTTSLLDPIIRTYFPNPLNTVPTYNGAILIDFGSGGLIVFNFLLGLVGSVFYQLTSRRTWLGYAFYSIWLSCLLLSFFANLFLNATIVTQFFLTVVVYFCLKPRRSSWPTRLIKGKMT